MRKLLLISVLIFSIIDCVTGQYDNLYPSPDGNLTNQKMIETSDGGKLITALEFCYNAGGSYPIEGCNQKLIVTKLDVDNNETWKLDLPVLGVSVNNPGLYEKSNGDFTIIYQFGNLHGCENILAGFTPARVIAIVNIDSNGNLISDTFYPEDCSMHIQEQKRLTDNTFLILARFDTRINNSFASQQKIQRIDSNGNILNELTFDFVYSQPKIVVKDATIQIFYRLSNSSDLIIEEYDQELNLLNNSSINVDNTALLESSLAWEIEYFSDLNEYIIFTSNRNSFDESFSEIIHMQEDFSISSIAKHQSQYLTRYILDNQNRIITTSTDFSLDELGDLKITTFSLEGDSLQSEIISHDRVERPEQIILLSDGSYAIAGHIDCCHGNPDGPAKTFVLEVPESQLDDKCNGEFNSQSDIDNFTKTCPATDSLPALKLSDSNTDPIINLDGLSEIKYIDSAIDLIDLNNLTDVSGLNNIEKINGRLLIGNLSSIQNFDGFTSLKELNGSLNFISTSFEEITGFGSLEIIEIAFFLDNNPNLTKINQLGPLEVLPDIILQRNPNLESLEFLSNIKKSDRGISISGSHALVDLSGLQNISSANSLIIGVNSNLTSLNGLQNIDPTILSDLIISENDILNDCSLDNICEYLASPDNFAQILGNEVNCRSRDVILGSCSTSTSYNDINDEIFLFPNPATTEFQIEGAKDIGYVITDLTGNVIKFDSAYSHDQIDISTLPAGAYIVSVKIGSLYKRLKLIKINE